MSNKYIKLELQGTFLNFVGQMIVFSIILLGLRAKYTML